MPSQLASVFVPRVLSLLMPQPGGHVLGLVCLSVCFFSDDDKDYDDVDDDVTRIFLLYVQLSQLVSDIFRSRYLDGISERIKVLS